MSQPISVQDKVKFLHDSYFVQFEGLFATFVVFYGTHKYICFLLFLLNVRQKQCLYFK